MVHWVRAASTIGGDAGGIVFLPARHYASAGLCDSDMSVCPSVRLSVTCRYCA